MVSNEEVSQRLKNKREGGSLYGYLVCNKCGGCYELQQGELPEHFNLDCECGGQLVQSATDSLSPSGEEYVLDEEYEEKYNTLIAIAYVFLVLFMPIAFVISLYLITRDHKWAKHDGKIIFAISLVIIFLYVIIVAFLIHLKYFSH